MNAAVLWVAWGKGIEEARVSAGSVARHMPDLSRILCTTQGHPPEFHQVIIRELPTHAPMGLKKLTLQAEALAYLDDCHALLLDSDTYMCAPVHDLFDVLDRFDVVGVLAPGRVTRPTVEPVPAAFAEYNSGVLALRVSSRVRDFFGACVRQYRMHLQVYKRGNQGALREMVWRSDGLQFWIVPCEYNFRFPYGGWVRGEIKILHGRPKELSYGGICRVVNEHPGMMRCWGPGDLATPHPKFVAHRLGRGGKGGT